MRKALNRFTARLLPGKDFESKAPPDCISLPKDEYENINPLCVFNRARLRGVRSVATGDSGCSRLARAVCISDRERLAGKSGR